MKDLTDRYEASIQKRADMEEGLVSGKKSGLSDNEEDTK